DIGPLPIELCRVVHRKERVKDDLCRNAFPVKGHPNRFGVSRISRTDRLVCGAWILSSGVHRFNLDDTIQHTVSGVKTPETSTGKSHLLKGIWIHHDFHHSSSGVTGSARLCLLTRYRCSSRSRTFSLTGSPMRYASICSYETPRLASSRSPGVSSRRSAVGG